MKYKSILLGLMLTAGLTATAQVTDNTTENGVNPHTTVGQERVLPRVTSKIHLLTRTYGDSIVLRWLPEDYVSYNFLATFGVNVLRVKHGAGSDLNIDTLALKLRPLKLEQFRQKYPANDSLALVALNVLYGEEENVSKNKGEVGNREDISNSQDMSFGFSMLACEWRPDLATDMAVRFTDRNVEPGAVYDYVIQPSYWDPNGRIIFEPGAVDGLVNRPYKQRPYTPVVKDSLVSPFSVMLSWHDGTHSSFEVERRQMTDVMGATLEGTKWERITQKPFLSMVEGENEQHYCAYVDSVPALGMWAYRILAYDSFGQLVPPAGDHSVFVTDIQPPVPPTLKYIVIERGDTTDLMAKVKAHIVWEKDSLEQDLAGYRIYYKPMRTEGDMWQMLNYDLISPKDTLYSVDVTGKQTGMVYISAYDHTGNESKSFIQQIRLTDYKAPGVPTNLRAEVRPIEILETDTVAPRDRMAYVDIYWQPCPDDDDIDYFDLAFANDSTHKFVLRNEGGLHQSMYTDTLSLNVNQRYIYYKVRAVDYATNIGDWSDWIQVERPHVTPPTEPHLGKSSHDEVYGMHMEWIVGADADMKYHEVYRRLGEEGEPELIGRYEADTVKAHQNTIVIDDNPPYKQGSVRYYYWVTSYNASPFTSTSLPVSWKHQGPRLIDVEIQLTGVYDAIEGKTVLMWDLDQSKLPDADWHYCVFRKGPGEEKFRYYMSTEKTDRSYREATLSEGETAEYYIEIRSANGHYSPASNTVSVTATARQELTDPKDK